MHQNFGRERLDLTRQIQTLMEELAVERRKNKDLQAGEDITTRPPQSERRCNQECERALEQALEQPSTDRCDTQATKTKWQPEQGLEATTLRYRRLGRAALVSPLTIDGQRCTESVENGCESDQRKRAKRSLRKETPFQAPNHTTASG